LSSCGADGSSSLQFKKIGPDIYTVSFPRDVATSKIESAAKSQCGNANICQVLGWNDQSKVAQALPMTDPEVISQVFNFTLNRNTGLEEAKWECGAYPSIPKDRCFDAPTKEDLEESGSE